MFSGQFNWTGGTLSGNPLTVSTGGALNISGNSTKVLITALLNAGTVNWTGGGSLEVDYSTANSQYGLIQNLAGGVWTIQNSARIYNNSPNSAYFQNAGTVQKSGDTGTTTISIPFYNSGTVTAMLGTMLFNAGGTIEGSFNAGTGATINFNSGPFVYNVTPAITGAGLVEVTGGTLALANDIIPNLQLLGGTISLGPEFQGGAGITNLTILGGTLTGSNTVSGSFTNGGNLLGSLTLLSGAMANWNAGSIQGPVAIAGGASLIITSNSTKYLWGPLTNAGTVTWSGNGSLEVDFSSANNQYGTIQNLTGALWDIQNSSRIYNSAPNGAYFLNAGTLRKSADSGTTTIAIPLQNQGTVKALLGTLNFSSGGNMGPSLSASSAATINLSGGLWSYTVPPVIPSTGIVELTGGSLTLLNDIIPNLQILGGTINLAPGFQGGAVTSLSVFGGTLAGNITVTGNFVTAAALTGGLTLLQGANVNWTGGSIQGPVIVSLGAVLTISGNSTKYLWGALTNAGTVTWIGNGGLEVDYSTANNQYGFIQNLAGALWDIQNSTRLYNSAPNSAYFQNAGTLQKSADSGTATISIPLYNSGTVKGLQGTLLFNGGGTMESAFSAAAGAAITFTGPFVYNTPPVVSGPGLVQFAGGTLTLANDIIPNLQLAGGTITLGPNFQGGNGITNLSVLGGTLTGNNTVVGSLTTGASMPGSLALLPGATVNWSGGSIQGPVNIPAGASLNLLGTSTKYLWGALTNGGTVTWSDNGNLEVDYSSANTQYGFIQNLPGALWDIQNSARMYNSAPNGAYFQNAGTVQKSADPNTTGISIPFTNTGTTKALVGTLSFTGPLSLVGGTLVGGLSSLNNYGQFNISGNAALAGGLSVIWSSGFAGALSNSFTVVNYGSFSGSFSPFSTPPGATWLTNYGSRALTLTVAEIQRLTLLASPGDTNAGAALSPLVVQVNDAVTGNPIAVSGVPVTVSLAAGSGTLSGTLTRNTDANGKAAFNDLSINLVGTKALSVSAPTITPATTPSFSILPAVPAQLALVTPIGSKQVDGGFFQPFPAVQVQDAFGNVVPGSTAPVAANVTSSATGFLGGTATSIADGFSGRAVFTNLNYSLRNPQASESITVFFTSPGLSPVTNPPILINFIFGLITLQNGNSVVRINPTENQGVFSWKVDGTETLYQEWFWLRQGASGGQVSLDTLGLPLGVTISTSYATINYNAAGLSLNLGLVLSGGPASSGASDLTETLSVQNTANSPITLHLFEYADFNLAGLSGTDTISFPTTTNVMQQGGNSLLTETAQFPAPNFWEASFYPITLDKISGSAPATLSDTVTPQAAGDQTFAYQWDLNLSPGQVVTISTLQSIRASGSSSTGISLGITFVEPNVIVSWPTNAAAGFELQSTADPNQAGSWSNVTNVPAVVGQEYQVAIPQANGLQFYRLRR